MMLGGAKELCRRSTPALARTKTGLRVTCDALQERRQLNVVVVRVISSNASGISKGKVKSKGGKGSGVDQKQRR
ncbi:unnamed protein product, partial [Scytosiphon promiscuus]